MRRILALAAAVIFAPCLAGATDTYVQAESFTNSYNILPENIRAYNGSLVGIDYHGEWAEFQVSVPAFGTYQLSLRVWGEANTPYLFYLKTRPIRGEDPQTITISYAGMGFPGS
jgi:hypothetical protein